MALSDDLRDASRRFHTAMRRGSLLPKKKRARKGKPLSKVELTELEQLLAAVPFSTKGTYSQWPVKAPLPTVTDTLADVLVRYGHIRLRDNGRTIGIPETVAIRLCAKRVLDHLDAATYNTSSREDMMKLRDAMNDELLAAGLLPA